MSKYSAILSHALESECAHSMEPLMQAKNTEDFTSMIDMLADDSPAQYKARALFALGRWGDNKATSAICKAVPNMDEVCRLTAADSLSRLNSAAALDGLLNMANDVSPHVRKVVLKGLTRFDKPKAKLGFETIQEAEKERFVQDYGRKLATSMLRK